jgi:hypothetical protein
MFAEEAIRILAIKPLSADNFRNKIYFGNALLVPEVQR